MVEPRNVLWDQLLCACFSDNLILTLPFESLLILDEIQGKNVAVSRSWYSSPAFPVLRGLRRKDHRFKASLWGIE